LVDEGLEAIGCDFAGAGDALNLGGGGFRGDMGVEAGTGGVKEVGGGFDACLAESGEVSSDRFFGVGVGFAVDAIEEGGVAGGEVAGSRDSGFKDACFVFFRIGGAVTGAAGAAVEVAIAGEGLSDEGGADDLTLGVFEEAAVGLVGEGELGDGEHGEGVNDCDEEPEDEGGADGFADFTCGIHGCLLVLASGVEFGLTIGRLGDEAERQMLDISGFRLF
jgi:hypothetical protein